MKRSAKAPIPVHFRRRRGGNVITAEQLKAVSPFATACNALIETSGCRMFWRDEDRLPERLPAPPELLGILP